MSTKDYVDVAYDNDLEKINHYIYKKEVKKTWLAKKYGCSRTTLDGYLNGTTDAPHRFILFMQHLMKSDPCQ
ncbi:MAG: hypothetical protein ACI35S_04905 [Anaeroplasma sp.]